MPCLALKMPASSKSLPATPMCPSLIHMNRAWRHNYHSFISLGFVCPKSGQPFTTARTTPFQTYCQLFLHVARKITLFQSWNAVESQAAGSKLRSPIPIGQAFKTCAAALRFAAVSPLREEKCRASAVGILTGDFGFRPETLGKPTPCLDRTPGLGAPIW
jgi:hypothetical protein